MKKQLLSKLAGSLLLGLSSLCNDPQPYYPTRTERIAIAAQQKREETRMFWDQSVSSALNEMGKLGFKPSPIFQGHTYEIKNLRVDESSVDAAVSSDLINVVGSHYIRTSFSYTRDNKLTYTVKTVLAEPRIFDANYRDLEQIVCDSEGLDFSDNKDLVDSSEKFGRKVFEAFRSDYINRYGQAGQKLAKLAASEPLPEK